MVPLSIVGVGFWTPGFPSLKAWTDGASDPLCVEPGCKGYPRALLRGTSVVTRAALEVAEQAAADAHAACARVPTVFASSLGEIQTAVTLVELAASTGAGSPLRFKNSVHNTASGIFGIAFGNRGFSTSLSAGPGIVAMALLEACALLAETGGEVVVAMASEPTPEPLDHPGRMPLGVGLCLRAAGVSRDSHAFIAGVRRSDPADEASASEADPITPAIGLILAVREGRTGTVTLGGGWCAVLDASREP